MRFVLTAGCISCSVFPDTVERSPDATSSPDANDGSARDASAGGQAGGVNTPLDASRTDATINRGGSAGQLDAALDATRDATPDADCEKLEPIAFPIIQDAEIVSDRRNANFGAVPEMTVASSAERQARTLLQANVSWPSGDFRLELRAAELRLNLAAPVTEATELAVYLIQRSPPRAWIEERVTWDRYDRGNPWTSSGGDVEQPAVSRSLIAAGQAAGSISLNVSATLEALLAGDTPDFGWLVQSESATSGIRFFSKEHELGPSLRVELRRCPLSTSGRDR